MLHKQFSIIEIYQVKINTNITNIKHIELWLNDKFFNHTNIFIGALVMFTKKMLPYQKE